MEKRIKINNLIESKQKKRMCEKMVDKHRTARKKWKKWKLDKKDGTDKNENMYLFTEKEK
jgi:hypothetical protein